MHSIARQRAGFSLLELLIVVSLMGILAGLLIPNVGTSVHEQLQSAARVVAADIGYARSLALANGSNYRLTFSIGSGVYTLQHTGPNAALNTLPASPWHPSLKTATKQQVSLDSLPHVGSPAYISVVFQLSDPAAQIDNVEFGPLGESLRAEETVIWLEAGAGTAKRYLSIRVYPLGGLTRIENFLARPPTAADSAPTGSTTP